MRVRLSVAALVAAASLAGCSGSSGYSLPNVTPVQQKVALQAFPNCADLEQYIEDTAVLDMRSQLTAWRDGNWGGGWYRGGPMVEDAATPNAGGSAPQGPSSYTQTNTQVAGVDEADFVKNDGTRIFALSGDKLYITRSWPADQLALAAKVTIEGWPREMFLDERDRVVVFSAIYTPYTWAQGGWDAGMPCDWRTCGYYNSNTVKVTVIDVADLGAPRVVREEYLPGSYLSSRRVGPAVRLVLNDSFRWPAGVRWWLDNWNQTDAEQRAAWNRLMDENERLIRAQTLAEWLPTAHRKLADGTLVEVPNDCRDFSRPNGPTRLGLVTVATLNLDGAGAMQRTSVVAQSDEIYASPTALYVANRHWWWSAQPGQTDYTYLHKFDISQPDRALYRASGVVEGTILDQFSMDEHNGYFRVATTATKIIDSGQRWQTETSNRVSVLAESGSQLTLLGRTPELAQGERLYSSRFLGDKAFVVTYRQTDPLFTIDLSNPAVPRVMGELKVPGFSTYLHPLDANHLLAIGTYLPDPGPGGTTDWSQRALKLTVFDVSDLAHPREKFGATVGTAYSWSEALYEHKAFNYFPEKGLLAIPFSDWRSTGGSDYWSGFVSDLRVFKIDPATGITPQGALSMSDMYSCYTYEGWTWYWTPSVRRSVMADDFVYAITDAGIRSARLGRLSVPLKTVAFDKQ